eukprot:1087193_1
MADEKQENKEPNDGTEHNQHIEQTFNDVEFEQVQDKFSITIEYDSDSELLFIKLINQLTKNVFEQAFDEDSIRKIITDRCYLKPHLLARVIIDALTSNELTAQKIRIFLFSNIHQATAKCEDIRALATVPDAINIPTGFEPRSNDDTDMNKQNYLLFTLHFAAPPYIYFNYCFVIKEKNVSDIDKVKMTLFDLQNENNALKDTVDRLVQTLQAQQQQMDDVIQANRGLAQRLQQLETQEEIELNLENGWKQYDANWNVPKAIKSGNVVYLNGLMKDGQTHYIATLPEGWRPTKEKMFSQCSHNCQTRVDVHPNGVINQVSSWNTYLSLDGITYVVQRQ